MFMLWDNLTKNLKEFHTVAKDLDQRILQYNKS